MRRGFGCGETAVSDVIGTVLLLGITVSAFSVLSIAVLDQFDRNPPPARIEFRVDSVGPRTSITAVWGEPLDVEETKLIYEVDNARTIRDLDAAPLSTNLVHHIPDSLGRWDVGETLRLACPVGEACAYPGKRVTNVSVVQKDANTVIFSSETGVGRGSILNSVADLVLTIESITDPARPTAPLYAGGTIQTVVKVRNDGVLAVPSDRQIDVAFFLDGSTTPFHTDLFLGGLVPGGSFVMTAPSFTASTAAHSLRVLATTTPSVIEAGYGNNEVTRAFTVVSGVFDPGAPYEDGNDDVLYNPYTATDALLTAAAVTDGFHTASASKGLVIPPSVGAIVTPGSISFSAPSGRLTIRAGLETTTALTTITLNGATALNMTGSFDIKTWDDLTLTSAGQIDLSGVRLDTNADDIIVTSTGGRILAVGTSLYIAGVGTLPDDVRLTSGGTGIVNINAARFDNTGLIRISPAAALYAQSAIVKAGSTILYNMPSGATVYAAASSLDDADDCADVDPSSATILGVPIFGRVQTTC
jgi:hypothetical protein